MFVKTLPVIWNHGSGGGGRPLSLVTADAHNWSVRIRGHTRCAPCERRPRVVRLAVPVLPVLRTRGSRPTLFIPWVPGLVRLRWFWGPLTLI